VRSVPHTPMWGTLICCPLTPQARLAEALCVKVDALLKICRRGRGGGFRDGVWIEGRIDKAGAPPSARPNPLG
jgi:hypothetical protein